MEIDFIMEGSELVIDGLLECEESIDELAVRHKRETRELETRIRFMLKQAKKNKKAETETEVIRAFVSEYWREAYN